MKPRMSDYDVEQFIGRMLQLGVVVATTVTLIGGALLLIRHGSEQPNFSEFRGEPAHLTSIGGILRGVRGMHSDSIVQLGILLLIATPVARVAFTLVAFVLQKDRVYIALTSVVLALLAYGLIIGKA